MTKIHKITTVIRGDSECKGKPSQAPTREFSRGPTVEIEPKPSEPVKIQEEEGGVPIQVPEIDDVVKLGPTFNICSHLYEQLGVDGTKKLAKAQGIDLDEDEEASREKRKIDRYRRRAWSTCPNRIRLCGAPGCPMMRRQVPIYAQPGTIGIANNQVAFHIDKQNGAFPVDTTDPCVLQLAKVEDGTQCIVIQYDLPITVKPRICTTIRDMQVQETDFPGSTRETGPKKGKGKKKSKGKGKGKGKKKGKRKSKK